MLAQASLADHKQVPTTSWSTIRRFGDWVLHLSPPEAAPVTALNLTPGALFPGGRFDPYPG